MAAKLPRAVGGVADGRDARADVEELANATRSYSRLTDRAKIATYAELGLTALFLTAPGGGPQVDDLPERENAEPLPQPIHAAAPNIGPIVNPPMHAVNGFVLVTYKSDGTERFYLSRSPDFIADKIQAGREEGLPVVEFWDKLGHTDARRHRVVPALVREVRVQHLEPDLDAIFDFDTADYVLG